MNKCTQLCAHGRESLHTECKGQCPGEAADLFPAPGCGFGGSSALAYEVVIRSMTERKYV